MTAMVLAISPDDPLAALVAQFGDRPVVDLDGVHYELRVSELVPAGEAYLFNLDTLDVAGAA